MDPYQVLNVPRTVTLDQLKEAYRVMAFKTHPDKGGSAALFEIVTNAFKTIYKTIKMSSSDRQFDVLKRASRQQNQTSPPSSSFRPSPDGKDFSLDTFNRLFDQHRLADAVRDTGHGEFLATVSEDGGAASAKRVPMSRFHQEFDDRTKKASSKHLVRVSEPECAALGHNNFTATLELGKDRIDDFSGENLSKKSLHFTDVALAHTTSRIVDPTNVSERTSYRNLEHIEQDRGNVSFAMTEEQRKIHDDRRRVADLHERKRLETVAEKDRAAFDHYRSIHQTMLTSATKHRRP